MLLSKKSKIFNTVHSSSARTCILRDREVHKFSVNSPDKKNGDKLSLDNDTHLKTTVGNVITCCAPCNDGITGVSFYWTNSIYFDLTWNASSETIYYTVHVTKGDNEYGVPTITYPYGNDLTARVVYSYPEGATGIEQDTFTVVAHKQLCTVQASVETLP